MVKSKFIPYYPTIYPEYLFRRPEKMLPFPLSSEKKQYYYFARNGIWHAIDLLGLTQDTEVLMPAYNNGMELAPFVHKKIPLVYYRVDRNMKIDMEDLINKITSRTKVIYVTYYLGFPHPIQEIKTICDKKGLYLFEDCALSLLSEINGRPLGSYGDVSIFCLAKFLPVPNGGMLVINNPELPSPPVRTVPPHKYSVASKFTTKVLENMEQRGEIFAKFFRQAVNGSARTIIRSAGLTRIDCGIMEFLPDKVDWGMSNISKFIIKRLDYNAIKLKRRSNYKYLLETTKHIKNTTQIFNELPEGVTPLFFPLFVADNQALCRELRNRKISAGGFWNWNPPALPLDQFPDIRYLRNHVLELQIHQDLNKKHLDYTVEQLKQVV